MTRFKGDWDNIIIISNIWKIFLHYDPIQR